ncbi:MAG: hypothetical protein SGBAC_010959 [Bacillariaceae sp.]
MRVQRKATIKKHRTNLFRVLSLVIVTICALVVMEFFFDADMPVLHLELGSTNISNRQIDSSSPGKSWCERIAAARSGLDKGLQIFYPCEGMKAATSAVVCMLTAGVESEKKATRVVFTARNYIEGAMALGQSVKKNIDTSKTHMLLLVREGFFLDPDDARRLEAVGWVIGIAPDFHLPKQYIPRFPRYKTTYTKVTAIGLAEYECAMLLDADALVVDDIRELMKCNVFSQEQHRVAATLDYFRQSWYYFNTGSILWRTSVEEMNRVFQISRDGKFMKRFSSDQEFLNHVYPDRMNKRLNNDIIAGKLDEANSGSVVALSWDYNAQTHVEVENINFWKTNRPTVKVLHFTEKKGWQCEERYDDLITWEDMPHPCDKKTAICFCREAHLYWRALRDAKEHGTKLSS